MTRIAHPPAFWLATCAGLALALVAALQPPGIPMVGDLPLDPVDRAEATTGL